MIRNSRSSSIGPYSLLENIEGQLELAEQEAQVIVLSHLKIFKKQAQNHY